jgi:ferritin-like metal-binding protein YciE
VSVDVLHKVTDAVVIAVVVDVVQTTVAKAAHQQTTRQLRPTIVAHPRRTSVQIVHLKHVLSPANKAKTTHVAIAIVAAAVAIVVRMALRFAQTKLKALPQRI